MDRSGENGRFGREGRRRYPGRVIIAALPPMWYGAVMAPTHPSSPRRVLLVEDDDVLRSNYESLLSAHRLAVCACATTHDAIAAFDRERFDVIILDVTLGREYEAGFDLCQKFREKQKATPIIFLTERDEDADRISGL